MSKFLDRKLHSEQLASNSDYAFEAEPEWLSVPNVLDLLARLRVGKEERITGSISIFCQDGRLFACLNDKQSKEVGFVELSMASINVISQIEESIETGSVRWRPAKDSKLPKDLPF